MADEKRDLFISYSNKNKAAVDSYVAALKSFGVSIWYQARDSKQDFLREINRGIKNSTAFVVFLSKASIDSIMVRNEINRAIGEMNLRPYKILPVVIEDLDEEYTDMIKLLLGSFNWLETKDFKDVYDLALAIIEQVGLSVEQLDSTDSRYSGTSEEEQKRIETQNGFFNRYADVYLDEVFEYLNAPNVLDIGCSDGKNIMLRMRGREYSSLLGVDKDEQKIAVANGEYGDEGHTFLYADITDPSFEDLLKNYLTSRGLTGFDLIHVSAVLLHIKHPERLISILYGALNKGGYLFIQDEDDGLNLVYPSSTFFDNCFYIWQHSLESGDRKMGRKLPSYLLKAGFDRVELKSTTISSTDFGGEMKEALWDLYFNPYLWEANSAEYFDNYEAFSMLKDYFAEHDAMKKRYMDGEIFITLGVLFMYAKK